MKLIGYLSNGYPSLEQSKALANHYIKSGCDVIEVDFPDYNPYLENDLIKGRMLKALESCPDYEQYMKVISEIKQENPTAQFILLAYETSVEAIGKEKFAQFAKDNDLLDLIFVGLKSNEIKDYLIEQGLKVSCYIQFHLPEDEIQFALNSNGFVYLQAKPTTGNVNPAYPTLTDCINYIRERGIGREREIYCGVGVHTPEDAKMVKQSGADGVFVGSAFLNLHNDLKGLAQSIHDFKLEC
ncbi:tryptophan synthase subunit alpha [Vibrio scophthalmi]|uniref:tryptophan synthase subunit alpha n=1 Tax=Vibrio TaxID=662 RepID=UPI00021BE92F|nr:tryptophan synthase subunit alpha [Vibrio sp. N418]EGU35257.1 tryptophan synthase, alpha subunit [Vibrio sp. N418]